MVCYPLLYLGRVPSSFELAIGIVPAPGIEPALTPIEICEARLLTPSVVHRADETASAKVIGPLEAVAVRLASLLAVIC